MPLTSRQTVYFAALLTVALHSPPEEEHSQVSAGPTMHYTAPLHLV